MVARPTPVRTERAAVEIGDQLRRWRKLQSLTAQQVAERAGVSVSAVYSYFRTRADLVTAVLDAVAAAIIAKVARDAELSRLDARFPGYGLAKHKGYGTPAHLKALREQGASPIHRISFAPCAKAAGQAR